MHEEGKTNFARFLSTKGSPEYDMVIKVLNTHEFVAAGIREHAYDEKLYKRMQCSTILRDWDALCGFVYEFRRKVNKVTIWQEFEWLANRWKKDPIKPNK
jgi:hypothetical protein